MRATEIPAVEPSIVAPKKVAASAKSRETPARRPPVRGKRPGSMMPRAKRTRESQRAKRARLQTIMERLRREYPEAECALEHENPVQLLVATILSAQCTDERVNQVTPGLFRNYPDAAALAAADPAELEQAIHSTGFYHNKAKNIQKCAQTLVEEHGGAVPREMEQLVQLPGVGRKTANVVRGACFGLPAITVDTHCGRLSRRLGLTTNSDPEKVERDLQQILPESDWWFFSSAIIWHGRRVCDARRPACARCVLSDLCPASLAAPNGTVPDQASGQAPAA